MTEYFPESLIQIEPNRRLLKSAAAGMQEFYSPDLNARVISMPAKSNDALMHEELVEFRLPVFSGLYRNNELWLNVPDDTRSLRKNLRFVARDIQNYGEIFKKLGIVYKQLDAVGIGFPHPSEQRTVLDSLAFSVDEDEPYGGNIHLIPSYDLRQVTAAQAVGSIALELEYSNLFAEREVQHLSRLVQTGLING